MPISQRDADIMQVESEFKIQQLLAEWQRSFLAGRTQQVTLQEEEQAKEDSEKIENV